MYPDVSFMFGGCLLFSGSTHVEVLKVLSPKTFNGKYCSNLPLFCVSHIKYSLLSWRNVQINVSVLSFIYFVQCQHISRSLLVPTKVVISGSTQVTHIKQVYYPERLPYSIALYSREYICNPRAAHLEY